MIKTKDGYGKLVGTAYKGSATDLLLSNGGIKAISDFSPASRGIFYIEGTGSTNGTWLGSHTDITQYYKGLTIAYKIPIAGASTTTLNINSLGAKTCYIATSKLTTHYGVGTVVILVYDGTYFRAADYWNSNTYSDCACTTAAATAAKTATSTYYVLRKGNLFTCTIQNTNTAASALTLNINSTGAKAIYLNGSATSSSNYSLSAGKYLVYYDGTNYWFYSDGAKIPRVYGSAESLVVNNCRGTAGSESNSKAWDSTTIDDNKLKVWDVYDDGGPTTYGNILEINGRTNHWKPQIWFDSGTGLMRVRNRDYNSTTWNAWRVVLDGSNYTSYTVKKDGTGASGTWGINITGSAGSVPWTGVSGRPTKLSEFTNDSGFITIDHTHDAYLPKTTYEYNKELACGGNGKICIGKFGAYDTNITITLSSTTSQTYSATIVIRSLNIAVNSTAGSCAVDVYGDANNKLTPKLSIFRPYGSSNRQIEVYADLEGYSKNVVHILAVALSTGYATDILTSVTSIPETITGKAKVTPTNLLVSNYATKSHTHTKSEITDFSHNHDSDYLKKSGGLLNTGATLKFDTYGNRFLTISGNSISADMSADTGTWAGAFATVKSTKETTTMLGWYGSYSGGLTHIFMGGTYDQPAMKMTPAGVFTFKNAIVGSVTGSAGSVAWENVTDKPTSFTPTSHTHSYISAKDTYSFNSTNLPKTFDLGVSAGFVNDSVFGSYGSVLIVRTYDGGGGTLQLYTPYSPTYGGTRLKARFGNYDKDSGNSWTALKELAWTTDIPTKVSQLENDSLFITLDHTHAYLPTAGGTMTGKITMNTGTGIAMKYTSSGNDVWMYPNGADTYGIRYFEGNPDAMAFSATGNNSTKTGADLCINGNGDGTVTIRGNTIWHAGNLTNVSLLTNDAGYLTSLPTHDHNSAYMRVIEQNSTFAIDAIPNNLAPGVHKIHISGKEYSSILCGNDYTGALWLLYFHPHASYDLAIKYRYRDGAWRTLLDSTNSSVSKEGQTLTVTINGTSESLTNSTYNFSGASFTSGQSNTGEHNCNNIKTNGHWYYTSNGPTQALGATTDDGALYTQAYSTSWVTQIAQDYRNGNLYTRSHKGDNSNNIPSGWLPWRKVAYIDDIPSNFLTEELDNLTTVTTRGNSTTNTITVGGLTSTGNVDLNGNLTLMVSNQHNSDLFIRFKYSTTDLDNYSWRIGYLGSGSGNDNRLVFLSNGNGTWANVLTFGLTDYSAVFSGAVTLSKLSIPTTSGGTTYGLGTSGQVLKTNGTTVYWASDSDANVTQTVTTSSNTSWRPIILGNSYSDAEAFAPTTTTAGVYASHLIKVKPSTGDLCLYSASGDSPRLIFQRGTSVDGTYDWDIHVTNGTLKFRRNNSNTWTDALSLYVNGDKITTPWPIISSSSITADAGLYSTSFVMSDNSYITLQNDKITIVSDEDLIINTDVTTSGGLTVGNGLTVGGVTTFKENIPVYTRKYNGGTYDTGWFSGTSSGEALSFVANSARTSFLFFTGPSTQLASWTSATWGTGTPAMLIYRNSVYINGKFFSGTDDLSNTSPSHALYVGGSVFADGTITADSGFSGNLTGNVTGNASSATKLATARTITLGTAVTATATSFNGTSNITIPVTKLYLGYLDWGGKSLSGEVSPIGCALSNEHNANRLAFLSSNAIDITTSSNGGSSYSAYSITAANKQQLVTASSAVNIGPTTVAVTGRTRILLGANGTGTSFSQQYVYTSPKKLLLNITTNGHGVSVLIEYATGATPTTYATLGTYALSGWSGWNDIPLNGISRFGGSATQTSQVWYIRLTFMVTSVSASYANTPPQVLGIRMYGDNLWRAPSTMSQTGHLYSFDISQNATFPAKVNAVSGFFQTSDESLKLIIRPISVDLDKLTQLRKVYFTWNELTESSELLLGMIALDVQKLYPEIVNTDGDHLSLAYDKLSVVALKAIDELYKLIQDLLLENSKLKLLLNSLNN